MIWLLFRVQGDNCFSHVIVCVVCYKIVWLQCNVKWEELGTDLNALCFSLVDFQTVLLDMT